LYFTEGFSPSIPFKEFILAPAGRARRLTAKLTLSAKRFDISDRSILSFTGIMCGSSAQLSSHSVQMSEENVEHGNKSR
jgi:hypothetical protein